MWSEKYNQKKCKECGTTKIRHHSFGLCLRCYARWRYNNDERVRKLKKKATYKWFAKNRERRLIKMRAYNKKYKKRIYLQSYNNFKHKYQTDPVFRAKVLKKQKDRNDRKKLKN